MAKDNNHFPEVTDKQKAIVHFSYKHRQQYWLDYFWHARKELNHLFQDISHHGLLELQKRGGKRSNPDSMRKYLLDAADKINACFYHLEQLKAEEKLMAKIGEELAGAHELPSGIFGIAGLPSEVIVYEVESFLWSFESSLEIFSRGVSYYFNSEAKFKSLAKVLKQSKVEPKKAKSISEIINKEKYRQIWEEIEPDHPQRSKRDLITHYRALKMIQTSFKYTADEGKVVKSQLREHDVPVSITEDQASIEEQCSKLLYLLCDFQIEVLEEIFDRKFKKGRKTSVYKVSEGRDKK